jgi:uncharacterized membrane protein
MKVRDQKIDSIRTIAILIMVAANASPYAWQPPYPVILRFIFSMAAPLFIFLSGYAVKFSLTDIALKNTKKRLFIRAIYLLVTAILIDMLIWGLTPFRNFDVLYVIAAGIALNALLMGIHIAFRILITLLVICGTYFIHTSLGYRFDMDEPQLATLLSDGTPDFIRFLSDGWFPLFPWVAFAISGLIYADLENDLKKHSHYLSVIFLSFFLIAGYKMNTLSNNLPLRDGYTELFYPQTGWIEIAGMSFTLFIINLPTSWFSFKNNLITLPGRFSLTAYIFHCLILSFGQGVFLYPSPTNQFIPTIIIFAISVYIICYLAETYQTTKAYNSTPRFLTKLIGI